MCDQQNSEENSMGSLTNGSEVFSDNSEDCNFIAAEDDGNRIVNQNFGQKFRVLKRTDQVRQKVTLIKF
jgi:hypothetical protein